MNIMITGGLGWLGKALAEVVSKHHTVRVFDLESTEAPREDLDFSGEVISGSVADFEAVRSAAAVASTVLRGQYKPGNSVPFDVNIRGTYNVLEAARLADVKRIILIACCRDACRSSTGRICRPEYALCRGG